MHGKKPNSSCVYMYYRPYYGTIVHSCEFMDYNPHRFLYGATMSNLTNLMEKDKSEWDVWTDDDGRVTATIAIAAFVDDSDAPYSFCRHAIRIAATGKRDAMAAYRKLTEAGSVPVPQSQ
jgi:hypothetical protein